MADSSDTLNIGSIRLRKEFPIAQIEKSRPVDSVNHPEAAAIARAKIAATIEQHPLTNADVVPATPTSDLITDKTQLAGESFKTPLVHGYKIPSALMPFLTAAGVFMLVLLLFKAPIIISQLEYSLSSHPQAAAILPASTISATVPAANTITIPKINVQAPVEYVPSIAEADIQTALQSGVVHYGNTAVPGAAGNVAIFGHSSNDWWEAGNYKFVFVLLDKLSPGDLVTLDYQSKRYTYQVTSSTVVAPTDVAVLNPTVKPTLTLITCSPPGTSLRRLVVTAVQIDPNPNTATKVAPTPAQATPAALTSNTAPGILDSITQAWNGVVSGIMSLFGGGTPAKTTTPAANSASQLPSAN